MSHRRLPNTRLTLSPALLSLTLLVELLGVGCARQAEPVKLDAFISGGTESADMGVETLDPLPDVESKLVILQTRAGSFSLRMEGFVLNQLCEASRGQLSPDGERVLCVPESISSPLRFHDLLSGPIFNMEGWEKIEGAYPTLAPSGDRFMAPIIDADNLTQLGIFDVFQSERARVNAIIAHGFVGPDHLVINTPPSIWAFEERDSEPFLVGANKVKLVNVPPYGVVYEQAGGVYFLGVNARASERLSDLKLIDVLEDRVLLRELSDGGYAFTLYDLRARQEVGRVEVPSVSFANTLNVRLVSRFGALAEEQRSEACGGPRVPYSLTTAVLDFRREAYRVVYEAETPHLAVANEKSPYALVMDVDPCARPTSDLRVWEVSGQRAVAMPSRVGEVSVGAVSRLGGWLAVWGEGGAWLIKSADLSAVPVRQGDPVEELVFR